MRTSNMVDENVNEELDVWYSNIYNRISNYRTSVWKNVTLILGKIISILDIYICKILFSG